MKLIIFEAQDRCGKDSHIQELIKGLKNYTVRHWSFPEGNTPEEMTTWQKRSFNEEFSHYSSLRHQFSNDNHVLVWNRSHIGEMVYGTIYRNSNPQSWVPQLETLYGFGQDSQIYLIHLVADVDFLVSQDDGNSYSNEIEKKSEEAEKFNEAIQQSSIQNKITIKINNGKDYRDFNAISNEIRNFIGI
jgi:polyphosphate kinase 2 (PPK2 family)